MPHPPRSAALAPPLAAVARQRALIGRALAHIDAHLDQRLDAATLAREAAMSPWHFRRVFMAHLGIGVAEHVTRRRLQRACALLRSGREPVLQVALAVGYESAQALAKAMRRELACTPTSVRRGEWRAWERLATQPPSPAPSSSAQGLVMIQPHRHANLPEGLVALTTTARGMVKRTLTRAARQAFEELASAVVRAGLMPRVRSCLSLCPDDPQGPDDPDCRYVAGFLFGHAMADGSGTPEQPDLPLDGTLAWWPLSPGPYAVFLHRGPYRTLHESWDAIYRDWLPASGTALRDAPPLELVLNDPASTPEAELLTEIWLPVATPGA